HLPGISPDGGYEGVWSFDVVSNGVKVVIVSSVLEQPGGAYPVLPVLDNNMKVISFDIDKLRDAEGSLYLMSSDYDMDRIDPKTVKNILSNASSKYVESYHPDTFQPEIKERDYDIKRSGMRKIRLSYDRDQKMAVLSCLTDLHSIPLVMAGFGTAWREVSMPEFFELTSIYKYR